MNVAISALPKCGIHALQRYMEELGISVPVAHIPFSSGLPKGITRHVFIIRDLRDALISAVRAGHQPGYQPTQGQILTYFRAFKAPPAFKSGKIGLIAAAAMYERWLTHPRTLVVRFEDLIAGDAALQKIAEFVEVPYLEKAWEHATTPEGLTATWTGSLSNWKTVWTPAVQEQWRNDGGDALLQRWGYVTS